MTDYLGSLLAQLATVTDELADTHTSLAQSQAAEHRDRIQSWWSTDWSTGEGKVSDRTRDKKAALDTLDHTTDIIEAKAAIEALTARRLNILTLIDVELTNLRLQATITNQEV